MNLVIIFRATEEEDMLQQVLAIISNLRCLWANVPVPVYMVSGDSTWPCCKLHLQARDAYTSPICINGHTNISGHFQQISIYSSPRGLSNPNPSPNFFGTDTRRNEFDKGFWNLRMKASTLIKCLGWSYGHVSMYRY